MHRAGYMSMYLLINLRRYICRYYSDEHTYTCTHNKLLYWIIIFIRLFIDGFNLDESKLYLFVFNIMCGDF